MISVLFARSDSVYKTLPECDVYDAERNALNYPGKTPIIAHPPCRAWGKLRHFAKPQPGEKDLARWAVDQIRQYGGVLEHPAHSTLWSDKGLPVPGMVDEWGGWTLPISQYWFGHKAEKKTWLYIVGCEPRNIPAMPIRLGFATHTISSSRVTARHGRRPEVAKAEREHTPEELARWLVELAGKTSVPAENGVAAV